MTDIFERNYRWYGYRRIQASLRDQSVSISEKVVRRLMKEECLVAATSKRRRYGSYMGEISPAPENLLDRDFNAGGPNEKWLTDITEFLIPAGKVYPSPMIDCFDGMVVSWSIGTVGGQAGFAGSQRQSCSARCRERGARQTTPHAKVSSVG
jgi:transposase InsO family protein